MKRKTGHVREAAARYDRRGILGEIEEGEIELGLDSRLRRAILSGERSRHLKNVTIKLDPVQVQAIRKIATLRSIPYQTLIRQWLAEEIKEALHIGA
ncbi:MAG: hypothetical protein HY608_07750 [Planctomycetes bacterium]|nr:hypothetical protein [Planctomycetota bacterium]